jgi:Calcineurin-like phosphoesterase
MAKPPTSNTAGAIKQAIEQLKQRQSPRIPGTHPEPFLRDPAQFRSGRSAQELAASQAGQLVAAPPPKRSPSVMDVAEVIGADAVAQIQQSGQIVFQTAGDTGAGKHEDLGQVVGIMAMDFHRPNPADRPAFFFHLGDVTYNLVFGEVESKAAMYQPQFYSPYADYPGKILAIAGNHDSNPQEDPHSIDVFQANFCAPLPQTPAELNTILQSPTRTPMYQPGVFFRLDAPFVQILGLFSNGGEYEGVIRGGVVGNAQWQFLGEQLKEIKNARDQGERRAFLLAVHHPPFSGGGGHSGSGQMLKDLDAAFKTAGIAPDAVVSGHAHNYQRFTRTVPLNGKAMQVPYIVAGNGGHNVQPMRPSLNRKPVKTPLHGAPVPGDPSDVTLKQYFNGFGHVIVTVTPRILTLDLIGTKTQSEEPVDSVTVDLASNTITHETAPFAHPANGEE